MYKGEFIQKQCKLNMYGLSYIFIGNRRAKVYATLLWNREESLVYYYNSNIRTTAHYNAIELFFKDLKVVNHNSVKFYNNLRI